MRSSRILLTASLAVAAGAAHAAEHVIAARDVAARVDQRNAQRERDVAAVRGVLETPEAARAAATLGADPRALRAGVAALGDAELRDLAQRAELLAADPVAGTSRDVDQLLVVFLIVAIVVLVLKAVD